MTVNKVYFFCLEQGIGSLPAYQYQSICLAEGLKELGVEIYANRKYWKQHAGNDQYLFNSNERVGPEDCDVVVILCQWFEKYNQPLPDVLKKKNRNYRTVFIDVCDGLFTYTYEDFARNFDVILKQKTRGVKYPSNCVSSWCYGVTKHLKQIVGNIPEFDDRANKIAVNFRNKHTIRDLAKDRFITHLEPSFSMDSTCDQFKFSFKLSDIDKCRSDNELFFLQSGERHHNAYISRMKDSKFCATFGGFFKLPSPIDSSMKMHRLGNYLGKGRSVGRVVSFLEKLNLQIEHSYQVYQWDSWRLWEAFVCGAVVLHVDFDKYGIEMPVMPENWKHYIGIDLKNPQESIDRILAHPEQLEAIAKNGREWAIQNYGPQPTAKRFLKIVSSS